MKITNLILGISGCFLTLGLIADFLTTLYGTVSFFRFDKTVLAISVMLGLGLIAFQLLFVLLLKAKMDKWKKIFVSILLALVFILDFAESFFGGRQFIIENLSIDIDLWRNIFLVTISLVITSFPSLCSLFLWDILGLEEKNL